MPKRILFVDDEDWSVTPYFPKLRDENVEVDLAKDGDEALDLLQKNPYDLLVLDIMLPPGSKIGKQIEPRKAGAILLRLIRQNEVPNMKTLPTVPVVILTAVIDHQLAESLKPLAVTEVFQKPAPFDEITNKLLAIINADTDTAGQK